MKTIEILLYLMSKDILSPLYQVIFVGLYISIVEGGGESVDTVDVFFLCAHHKAKDKFVWQNGQRPNTTELYIY